MAAVWFFVLQKCVRRMGIEVMIEEVANNSALSLLKLSLIRSASPREIGNSSTIYGGCKLRFWMACTRFGDYFWAKRLE